jgi:hypothetical protein
LEKLLGEIRGNVSAVTKRTSCLDGSRQNGDCWVSPIALNTKPKANPQHGPTVENGSDFIATSFSTWIATRKQRGWLDANDHGEVWN